MGQAVEKKLGSTFGLNGIFSRTKTDEKGLILLEYQKGVTTHVLYADGGTKLITNGKTEYFQDDDGRSPNREDRLAKKKAEGITYIGGYTPFLFWNSVAAFFHLLNAIATPFGANKNQLTNMYPMYQNFAGWEPENVFCNSTCKESGYIRERVDTGENMVIQPALAAKRYSVSLLWLIFSFHFLSFLFQSVAGCCFKSYYIQHVLDNGVNSFRFIEYSISASLMLLCIALIGSLQDVYAHIGLGVLTAATMLFGLIAEILFSDEFLTENISHTSEAEEIVEAVVVPSQLKLFRRARFSNEIMSENLQMPKIQLPKFLKMKKRDSVTYSPGDGWSGLLDVVKTPSDDVKGIHVKLRQLGWFAHICGWVTMGGAYGGILINHYFWSVQKSKEAHSDFEGPPDWVTALIFAIMGLYQIFGFTQLFQLCAKDPWCHSFRDAGRPKEYLLCVKDASGTGSGRKITCKCCCSWLSLNEGIELFYVLNSLVTKTILGWVIISQLLVLDFVITDTVDCE